MAYLQMLCVLFIISCCAILNVQSGSTFSFRRPLQFLNKQKQTKSAVTTINKTVDVPMDPALDEFKASLKKLGSEAESDMSIMARWDASMSALVNHYNALYPTLCSAFTTKEQLVAQQGLVVNECRARMQVFQLEVKNLDVSYESYLLELEGDLDDFISKLTFEEGSTAVELKQKISRWQLWRTNKWFQRAKWVAAQALMLAYNFGQYEVHRRLAKRAAEKRLAEVPEFPLL